MHGPLMNPVNGNMGGCRSLLPPLNPLLTKEGIAYAFARHSLRRRGNDLLKRLIDGGEDHFGSFEGGFGGRRRP